MLRYTIVLALIVASAHVFAAPIEEGGARLAPKLVCETIVAPKVDKKTLPASCDKVCASKELTCVWNTAPINPNGCDAPAYQACRCCGIEESK